MAAVDGLLPGPADRAWPLRVACVAVGLAAGYGGVRLRRPTGQQVERAPADQPRFPAETDIYSYAKQVEHYLAEVRAGADTPVAFLDMLLESAKFAAVTETVEIVGDTPRSRVTLEVRLDRRKDSNGDEDGAGTPGGNDRNGGGKADAPVVVVPVQRTKRVVFDSFEARTASGEKLTCLSTELTFGFLALTLWKYFIFTVKGEDPKLSEHESAALYAITRLVCCEKPIAEEVIRQKFDRAMKGLPDIGAHSRRQLLELCLYFAENTVAAVEVKEPVERIWVDCEYILTPGGRLATRHDRVRAFLGLPPFRYRVPLAWPFASQRYDLRVTGPDGQFVYAHGLSTGGSRIVPADHARARFFEHPACQVDVYRDVGLPSAHLSIRNAYRADPASVDCTVEFEEVPPGALGRTLLISATCSLLVVSFAFLMPHAAGTGVAANLGAILLASPAFAATWLGQSAERVQKSSVTTLVGLGTAGLISVVGSVLHLIQSATWGTLRFDGLRVLTVPMPPFDPPWLGLGFLSSVATVVLLVKWRHRMTRYLQALRRRDVAPARE